MAILLNGRDTHGAFAPPVSLREIVAEGLEPERTVRKLSRVLRTHFRRVREGGESAPTCRPGACWWTRCWPPIPVRRRLPTRPGATKSTRRRRGRRRTPMPTRSPGLFAPGGAFRQLPADHGVWNRIYRGVLVHHLDKFKQAAPGCEVVYVPSHRSHMDYLLLSYLLYTHGIVRRTSSPAST